MLPSTVTASQNKFERFRMLKVYIALVITFAATIFLLSPAHAFLKSEDIKPLDWSAQLSKEDFIKGTDIIEDPANSKKTLAYRMRLPKGWRKISDNQSTNAELNSQLFNELAVYVGPPKGDMRSKLVIRSLDLKRFVSAKNWFLNFVLINGITIEQMTVKDAKFLEAQYTILEDGQSYSVRAVIQISGSQILLAEYMVPTEYLEEERDYQVWAMASFKLTQPSTEYIEPTETYTFVDIVKFEYPKSWVIYSPPIVDIDRMEAAAINLKGFTKEELKDLDLKHVRLDGRIDAYVVAKDSETSRANEIKILNSRLREVGLGVGDLISSVTDFKYDKGIKIGRIDAYRVKGDDQKLARYEIWVGLLESDYRYYIVTLITVGREENFYTWAQNTETYKLVIETLSPVNDK